MTIYPFCFDLLEASSYFHYSIRGMVVSRRVEGWYNVGMNKKKTPLVSVIIPVYNVERYIQKCLDSVVSQTYGNIEIIVVNDASPGNITEIIKEYENTYENIKFVNLKKNGGLFRARVEGMKVARGDYILNVDGDDTICPDFIERMAKRAESTGADITLCEMVRYYEKDGSKEIQNLAKSVGYYDVIEGDGAALSELLRKGNYFWEVCGKLYSRKVVNAAMKDLDKIKRHILMGEDMLFNVHFFYYCSRLVRAEFAFYYYLINNDSITAKNTDVAKRRRVIEDLVFVFDAVQSFMGNRGIFDKYKRQYRYLRNMQAAKYHNDIGEDFKKRDAKRLHELTKTLAYDGEGYQQEIEIQEVNTIDDIWDLRRRLGDMNSIKASGLKFLSNVKRKLKNMAGQHQ
ncbi:glycosyltransferase family 2 protein [Candidatus Saccharibacteria bacterium]|nr:glycosyltransferase family 2 protein [Candidatus Saccharibacteria bacterium]